MRIPWRFIYRELKFYTWVVIGVALATRIIFAFIDAGRAIFGG